MAPWLKWLLIVPKIVEAIKFSKDVVDERKQGPLTDAQRAAALEGAAQRAQDIYEAGKQAAKK